MSFEVCRTELGLNQPRCNQRVMLGYNPSNVSWLAVEVPTGDTFLIKLEQHLTEASALLFQGFTLAANGDDAWHASDGFDGVFFIQIGANNG